MNFEEMKKIWDAQNNKALYAINEPALFDIVKRKINKVNKEIDHTEKGLILINFIVIATFINKGFDHENAWYRVMTIVIALLVSIYIYIKRVHRKKQEGSYDRTLLGDLDYAISNIKYHIYLGKTFIWWYMLPFGFGIVLKMYFNFDSKPLWVWLGMGVMFVVAYLITQWGAIKCHVPKQDALLALKRTLTQDI